MCIDRFIELLKQIALLINRMSRSVRLLYDSIESMCVGSLIYFVSFSRRVGRTLKRPGCEQL